jgi:hypothetical protein
LAGLGIVAREFSCYGAWRGIFWYDGDVRGIRIPGERRMEVAINLPDDIAQRVQAQWEDVPRHVLESFVLEGFRARVLTTEDVRRLLGFDT